MLEDGPSLVDLDGEDSGLHLVQGDGNSGALSEKGGLVDHGFSESFEVIIINYDTILI